jgi:hypothetical protein
MAKVYLNDSGTAFRSTVVDEEGDVLDISGASELKMGFIKPDQTVVEFDAELVNDGTDGILQYVTADGDVDQVGRWQAQPYVVIDGAKVHGEIYKFRVYQNVRDFEAEA